VPCAAASAEASEQQAKLDVAAAVYASVLPMMGARAGRVTDMLLAALTAAELHAALHAPEIMRERVQNMALLLQ
jgi:hypothetical protein